MLKSPIDGKVMDWELRNKLMHRPVVTGQVLVNIADSDPDNEWELSLLMPEKRMSYLDNALNPPEGDPLDGLPVTFILPSDPSVDHKGFLSREAVHARASLHKEDGTVVKMRVTPESLDGIKPRPGLKVIADVTCGQGSAAFVWFHEVYEWVQAHVLF